MAMIDDRHALNVRREAEALLRTLTDRVDALLEAGETDAACVPHDRAMDVMSALLSDDIAALEVQLDAERIR
jgi:hypothetical protein